MGRNLTVNGFPRSGTQFTFNLLTAAFPEDSIFYDVHTIRALKTSNCITPVRTPYKSIPSHSLFFGETDIEGLQKYYIRFYTKILENIDNVTIIDFEKFTINPLNLIKKTANKFDLMPVEINLEKINKNANKTAYDEINESDLMIECMNLFLQVKEKSL